MHSEQTFLDATSGGKFCFEITHNARVHVNFSLDLTTTLQSVDSISSEIFAAGMKWGGKHDYGRYLLWKQKVYYTKEFNFFYTWYD